MHISSISATIESLTRTVYLHVFLAVPLVLAAAGCAVSPVEQAVNVAKRGEYSRAVSELTPLAAQGDPAAQYYYGMLIIEGRGVAKNAAEGMQWLRRSAEQGYTKAEFQVGYFYCAENAHFYERDCAEALKWYRRAATKLNETEGARAAANIGTMYAHGQGVVKNPVEAVHWYRAAAEHGDAKSSIELGKMYAEGTGVAADFAEAIKWLSQAANKGNAGARYTLVFLYADGIGTTPSALDAAYWLTDRKVTAAPEANYLVGKFYHTGLPVNETTIDVLRWVLMRRGVSDVDTNRYLAGLRYRKWASWDDALPWYQKAAEAGHVGAQVNLGLIHWNKDGRQWNCVEAFKWTRMAAEKNDVTAQFNLGLMYRQGPDKDTVGIGIRTERGIEVKEVSPNQPAARAGIQNGDVISSIDGSVVRDLGIEGFVDKVKAARNKQITLVVARKGAKSSVPVQVTPENIVIKCSAPGAENLKQDSAEAVKWFQKAADQGNLSGLFYLAKAYENGEGVTQDYRKAMEYYKAGADRDDWEAAQAISHLYAQGKGVEKDREESERWFRRALNLKHKSIGR